jgi:putative PIN family toxin of toxin-antitoxin system
MGSVRVVYDTNVLISALGWGGNPDQCVRRALDGDVALFVSPDLLNELARVMEYPRFEFTDREKGAFFAAIISGSSVVNPNETIHEIQPDPDDDIVLECAVAADTTYIVSGDDHLRSLEQFRAIRILSPADFIDEIDCH